MDKLNGKVGGLKKVRVLLEAGTRKDNMDLMPEPVTFEWITGIGVEGFTPFEYALMEKEVGDTVELEIAGWRMDEMFGRLAVPVPENGKSLDHFFMRITIQGIEGAEQKEVVQAMAGMVGDCGGDCCGNH